ncbi:MAG TPA: potassium/proton antiporter [Alphaproteobacteria bacterium]|jgi:cell volume regulation protein A
MEFAHHLILIGAGLVVLSILAGLVSSRIGAPLLLVFLALGMLAGEDGPGGIHFGDFHVAYLVGSLTLAIILFDGGLKTTRGNLRVAWAPALSLATLGVLVTAILVGLTAAWALGLHWLQGMLIGSVVASTDAAAVFFLLHLRGMHLKNRVGATLEVESGLNDPMAIFLTVLCVELLRSGATTVSWDLLDNFVGMFLLQIAGGATLGVLGGLALLRLVNRLDIAPGLYPILAMAGAMLIFATAQSIGASGYMAIYLVGFLLGSRRHRATQLISRFSDGLAWLSQILMFLMLGLLVTPKALLPDLVPAIAIALTLVFVARPLAVALCLIPFRFSKREIAFISWVGLRGAVPIFLASIPVLSGIQGGMVVFSVAFVVVLFSMSVQGWTVAPVARWLGLELPPRPPPPLRAELDLPGSAGRDMAAYTVQPFSMATRRRLERLVMPEGVSIITIIRDGALLAAAAVQRLEPNDYVLVIAPSDQMTTLDRFFAAGIRSGRSATEEMLGEFVLDGQAELGAVASLYEFRVPRVLRHMPLGRFLRLALRGAPVPGRRLHVGGVDLIVRVVEHGQVIRVGLDVAPPPSARNRIDGLRIWLLALFDGLRQAVPARFRNE